MRIGIDAHAAERDGSGNCTHVRGLLSGLARVDEENEYILYATDPGHPFYEQFRQRKNFCLRHTRPENPLLRIPFVLGQKTFSDKLDILHVQYIGPFVFRGKLVVTIHDLAILHLPESFSRFELFRSKVLFPLNARRSDKIITVSDFSKKDITKQFRINTQKIEVIHNGVSPHFHPVKDLEKKKLLILKYDIAERFIFSLGRLNLRKNIESLIGAYESLRRKVNYFFNLVIGGQKDVLARNVMERIRTSEFQNDIIVTGYIPDEELPYFYSFADVFVFPSYFEGFGLPPVEAMACGCPVVTSASSSLPEIVGDAAILVDPDKPGDLTQAIYCVLSDHKLGKAMKERGIERVKIFDWDEAARKTLNLYRQVCEG
jgi:glycosyltransferase involved in cell wall biosynthesis